MESNVTLTKEELNKLLPSDVIFVVAMYNLLKIKHSTPELVIKTLICAIDSKFARSRMKRKLKTLYNDYIKEKLNGNSYD